MLPKYLVHLARLGSSNLHPKGKIASDYLIDKLDLKDGQSVLDLGCGTGETIIRLASRHNVRIDGIDAIPEMLQIAQKRIKRVASKDNIHLTLGDFDSPLPFKDETYDRVYAESVLGFQSYEQIKFLLKEISRILKNDGLFVMNEAMWKKAATRKIIDEINRSCIEDFGLCQASGDAIYLEDWLKLIEESNFKILSYEDLENIKLSSIINKTGKFNSNMIISRLVTASSRVKGFLDPLIRKQIREYKNKLKRHKYDGKYIESRLLAVRKN
jgi:ubiquinone/menaquinone biosynthesis C-methylase UbiE